MPPQVVSGTATQDQTAPDDDAPPHPGADPVDRPGGPPDPDPVHEAADVESPVDTIEQDGVPGDDVEDDGVDEDPAGVFDEDHEPGDESAPRADPEPRAQLETDGPPTLGSRLKDRRLRARKVRRTIRHIDPWSVLKFSLFFFLTGWVVIVLAGVILWSLAVNAGVITEFEDLVIELFDLTSFAVDPDLMFRVAVFTGGAMAIGGALFVGVLAVLFNLLSDLVGGIRVSVIEEETARPVVE